MARPCVCSLTPLTQCLSVSLSTQTFGQLSSPGRGSVYFLTPFWIDSPRLTGEDPELSEGRTGTHSHTETTAPHRELGHAHPPAHRPRDVVEDLVSGGVRVRTGLGAKQASQLPCTILSGDKGRGAHSLAPEAA